MRPAGLAAVAAAAGLLLPLALPATPAAGRPARAKADSVSITVNDVSPVLLPFDAKTHPLTVSLTVTNNGTTDLNGLTIQGERGDPFTTTGQLNQVARHPAAPTGSVVPIEPTTPVRISLLAGESEQVVFRSTTSTSTSENPGLCNCATPQQPLLYPLYFSAHHTTAAGIDESFGLGATVVAAFNPAPAPVRVSWVWPLIDQPHLLDDTATGARGPVFTDDFLAASVGSGGRLDRALAVAEQVARDPAKPPLTLVVDPELLQELQIMSSGPYQVQAPADQVGTGKKGKPAKPKYVAGTGRELAAAWLLRLRALLASAPQLHLALTDYADPDVEALRANGLGWSANLPAGMRDRVEQALGRTPPTPTVAWPVGGALSSGTLAALAGQGITTVLLNSSAVMPKPAATAVPPGFARIPAGDTDLTAGLLDPALQRYVLPAIGFGRASNAAFTQLMTALALRAVQEPTTVHAVVLAPPRWIDADVAAAARVIEGTSTSVATRPLALGGADEAGLVPNQDSRLARVPPSARTLPSGSLGAVQEVRDSRPALRAILTPPKPQQINPQAQAMLDQLPLEAQRVASSAWGRNGNERAAAAFAHRLTEYVDGLTDAVQILSAGSYTLASENSPLPITVRNGLPWPVTVQVQVVTSKGLLGFTAKPLTETVEANQKASFKLHTKVDLNGRIQVVASLYTPDGKHHFGETVQMTVRSTALGVVGVTITVVAGTVLALALLIRFGRRLQHRRRRNGSRRPRRPHWDPDSPDAARTFAETVAARSKVSPAERTPVERAP